MKTQIASLLMLLAACGGCRPSEQNSALNLPPLQLHPLSPFTQYFDIPTGKGSNTYYYVEPPEQLDAAFRHRLRSAVEAAEKTNASKIMTVHSIYVYRAIGSIGKDFNGSVEMLRGHHARQLLSFARWTDEQLDIFYIIDNGQVVFDLLEDKPVSPSQEFK